MNLGTIIGLVLGLALMGMASFIGASDAGVSVASLFNFPSILIVFGGSLAPYRSFKVLNLIWNLKPIM